MTKPMKRIPATVLSLDVLPPPKTLQDAVEWSSWAIRAVTTDRIDARTAHEIGYLVNAFKAAIEKRDLLREIDELKTRLKEHEKRPGRIA